MSNQDQVTQWKMREAGLRTLKSHPGFAHFEVMLKQQMEMAYGAMMKSKDAHEMAKSLGMHAALRDMSTWVDREVAACEAAIRSAVDDLA